MDKKGKKQSFGRRKIEIKKIESPSSLLVTFSKRRMGLFKKAGELSVLSGAEVAVLVSSPSGKIYAFGSPSATPVMDRFLTSSENDRVSHLSLESNLNSQRTNLSMLKYRDAATELEAEKLKGKMMMMEENKNTFWWDEPMENLTLEELEERLGCMKELLKNVKNREQELAMAQVQV